MSSVSKLAMGAATDQVGPVDAVIYCRVSSVAQLQKGHGNSSQETRCREFARHKGYDVVEVFADEAISGGLTDRPGIKKMLAYLKTNSKKRRLVVLIDDISRLARDLKAHLELRSAIAAAGARLESPSVEFGEDSDSILVENLLASVSQHFRQKNGEQTLNRMQSRMSAGYWPFTAPVAYRQEQSHGEGKLLVRDEPVASIVQEALEGFASGRFQTQAEVRRFLETHPDFPKSKKGRVRNSLVPELLTNPIYAGYVERKEWDISLRKGRHQGLIDFTTFERIQDRLNGKTTAPARSDIAADFPLRGTVACACCGHPMTANWSKSKTGKKYPYYSCFNKGCERSRESFRRDEIEGQFVELLESMTPTRKLFDLARVMFKDAWEQRSAQASTIARSYENESAKLQQQINRLLDRIGTTESDSVVSAYEKRIAELERQKLVLAEKREKAGQRQGTFEEMFELAFSFLSSPSKIWALGKLEYQKLVLRLTFADRLEWCPKTGFRTPKTTLPFKALGDVMRPFDGMAERVGFEPTVRKPALRFSRPARSTTPAPLRRCGARFGAGRMRASL